MFKRSIFAAATLGALLLAGCSTAATQPAASAEAKSAPATVSAPSHSPAASPAVPVVTAPAVVALPATIKGSEESSALLDNFTAFVIAVDGVKVEAGREGWDQPLSLEPGKRRLSVEFNRGVFLARTEILFEAKSGAAYELRHASDAQVYGSHSYCEFWIVDLTANERQVASKRAELVKQGK